MPRIRTLNTKKPPEGWDDVLPQLEEFAAQMRDAVNEPHEGKRRNEATWPITKIHYERSRYVYELYYKKKAISKELYDYLIMEKHADAALIAKWKKPGYEYLCSLSAIDKRNSNFGTTAMCRVPLHLRKPGNTGASVTTGCVSCASQESGRLGGPIWWDSPRPADLISWAKAGCPTSEKPGKKRKEVNEEEELEARALQLRKGSHAGVRDQEAIELERCAASLRANNAGASLTMIPEPSEASTTAWNRLKQMEMEKRNAQQEDADDDSDITGDEAPEKDAKRPRPDAPPGGEESGTVTPPAPAAGRAGHATPEPSDDDDSGDDSAA